MGRGRQQLSNAGTAQWSTIVSEDTKRKAKDVSSFGGISYADAVRKIQSKNTGGKGGGKQQQGGAAKQQDQQQDKSKGKRGNGCYVVCPAEGCKGYAYTAQMAGDSATCRICTALFPREWLSQEQQRHWDCIAEYRGLSADGGKAAAEPSNDMDTSRGDEKEEDLDIDDDDEYAGNSLKELEEKLGTAETDLTDFQTKFEGILSNEVWGNTCNQLLARVNVLKERITAAKEKEPSHTDEKAAKLHRDLKTHMDKAKEEQTRAEKWETKAATLDKEAKEAMAHAKACRQSKDEAQKAVQAISQELAQITSGEPPAAESIEEAPTAEAELLLEMEQRFEEALKQQRESMLLQFAAYQQQMQGQAPQQEGGIPVTTPAGAASSDEAPSLAKLGENVKKQSASLASKAASSVIKSNTFAKKGAAKPPKKKQGDGIDEEVATEENKIGSQVDGLLAAEA